MVIKHISQTLNSLRKNSKLLIPISHLHTRNKTLIHNPAIDFVLDEVEDLQSLHSDNNPAQHVQEIAETIDLGSSSTRVSHQWPEWDALMKKLSENGYFDGVGNPYRSGGSIDGKGCNQIRTACLNFARDRSHLMRYFTSGDIQVVAGFGCPSIDRKVVNSSKRLRAHVGIDEGNVCSSCILRGNCERAYVKAREDEGGRTVDVMRIVVTYGLHHITHSEESKTSVNKRTKESIRSIIAEMVEFSMDAHACDPSKVNSSRQIQENSTLQPEIQSSIPTSQGNWNCPKCKLLNFAKNIKCIRCHHLLQERVRKLGNNQDHLQLKKGDWMCLRCNFLNFAKNTRCLQCHENPPKRQLNPGEWECDSCNYINFRRNMVCLKCDYKRAKALNNLGTSLQPNYNNGTRRHSQLQFEQQRGDKYQRNSERIFVGHDKADILIRK